jgi:spore germination protein YaaH/putative cell wall-binding protein
VTVARRLAAAALALIFALSLSTATALGADPAASSVTLPDGTVLPPPPDGALRPSVQSEMLAEHGGDPTGVSAGKESLSTSSALGEGGISADAGDLPQPLSGSTSAFSGPAGALPNGLTHEVFGFLPYWMLDAEGLASIRYDLTSTIAYFSIGAQSSGYLARGTSSSPTVGWSRWTSSAMTDVINKAHARGVRVVPTITMMAWDYDYSAMSTLLNSVPNRAQLVTEITNTIRGRNADGVNIDFEPVPSSLRSQFTAFIRQLKAGLVAAGVGSYVTVDTSAGAAAWATGYDIVGLTASGAADALMVMGYDLNWSGSSRAGGVAPIDSPYVYDVRQAMSDHLKLVSGSKLIWGVPYYGRAWPTTSYTLNAPTRTPTSTSYSTAWTYATGKEFSGRYGRKWDAAGQVPWFAYQDAAGGWREGYYDDPASLEVKYKLVTANGVSGIGIWSLGMDAGTSDLANVIYDRFVKRDVRIDGPDRYSVSAALSASAYQPGVAVAYLASGQVFPDALAGAPLAKRGGGPLLLVRSGDIPAPVAAELGRLKPGRIVILGGPGSVGDAVARAAAAYTGGTVSRLSGADRYAAAAAMSAATFSPGNPLAYVATGQNFPDALAGAAVAARDGAPVLLVRSDAIPAATASELGRLKPGRIVLLGGPGSVSDAVADRLAAYTAGGVTRLAGPDRYAAAAAISAASYPADGPATAYVATGTVFSDSLSASALAGRDGGPLLLVRPDSLPAEVADELRRLNPSRVVIVGGPASVSDGVRAAIAALWR